MTDSPPPLTRRPSLRLWRLRSWLLVGFDAGTAALALWGALLLRFEGTVDPVYLAAVPRYLVFLLAGRVVANLLFKLHRWSFRFSGLTDGVRIVSAGLLGTGLFLMGLFLAQIKVPPRSVVVLELFLSTAVMGLVRFSPRLTFLYLAEHRRWVRNGAVRTVIVGAGAAGELLLRDLQRSVEHNYRVVGFVDDDPDKWGSIVGGRPVLGAIAELPEVIRRYEVGKVLIAIPRLEAWKVREILSLCAALKVRFKILPVSFVYLRERVSDSMLADIAPEDVLDREEVDFSRTPELQVVRGRRVLVTGAAGSIGSEICLQLARCGVGSLVMVDINENGLYLLQRRLEREFPALAVTVAVADIRDRGRMDVLLDESRPQDIFHAAAHKHVPLLEACPGEAVKNNVLATWQLVAGAVARRVERFVYISTDKAVRPTSVMGATKRLGERVVQHFAANSPTAFCVVRFGNVLGSAGSVVPLFREQIAAGGPVTVTHPEVRRYFMTIGEAAGLVLKAAYGNYGQLCILDMGEQIKILDLARHMITMAGLVPEVDVPIVFTGLRPGEKLAEELLTEAEERTRRVNAKLLVAASPPPPPDFEEQLEALARTVELEDAVQVRRLLQELVPSYAPPAASEVPATVPSEGRPRGARFPKRLN
jgi:FlaA1/EpsC-like NDP-sugar epimerase